jgi:hypothetical protein
MEKNSEPGSGINIPEYISETLVTILLGSKYFGCFSVAVRDLGPGFFNPGSGI